MNLLVKKIKKFLHANLNNNLPSSLIFFVTNLCNLACEHCFYRRSLNTKKKDLTIEEIERISRGLGDLNNLNLSGGEPFIREDIDKVVKIFYKNNNLKFTLIPTNGSFVERVIIKTKEILDRCPEMYLSVLVSLDGLETTHNRIREGANGPGESFKKAMKTIGAVKELQERYSKLMLVINAVVHDGNVEDLRELKKLIKDNFGITLDISMYRDGVSGKNLKSSLKNWTQIKESVCGKDRKYENFNFLMRFFYNLRDEYINYVNDNYLCGKATPLDCVAGKIIAVIDHNGDVKVCENYEPFANLRHYDYDFKQLWLSPSAKKEKAKVKNCFCVHPCFINCSMAYSFKNYSRMLGFKLSKKLNLPFPNSKKQIVI